MKLALGYAVFLLTVGVALGDDKPKSNIKATHIAADDIAVSCKDGKSPQVKDLENGVVVVSCSK